LLRNSLVSVAGGDGPNFALTAASELYDPVAGTSSLTGMLPLAVREQTATLLRNGTVLATGGVGSPVIVANAEIYNPARGTCRSVGNLNEPGTAHTATLLSDGEVLISAGLFIDVLASAELGAQSSH
jgi:hypothetical protein